MKIALSTNSDKEGGGLLHKKDGNRHKRGRKTNYFEEDAAIEQPKERAEDADEPATFSAGEKEKPAEPASEEHYFPKHEEVSLKSAPKVHHPQVSWTEIPQNQWNEHEPSMVVELPGPREPQAFHQPDYPNQEEKKPDKPGNLQALVDAIGTRMRDIESVVQRMSEKVHQAKQSAEPEPASAERRAQVDAQESRLEPQHHEIKIRKKKPNPDEHYKRFSSKKGSKYLHGAGDGTTEEPLFIEDTNMNGYFSDASNSLLRRVPPKEPAPTYMAPVESRRMVGSEESEKKHKKKSHKKKRAKGHHKKHHGKDDKRKRFNRLNSVELDKNLVSLEDNSGVATK